MKALVNGNQIVYHRHGQGEPMLLVHGITTYSFIWDNLVPGLSGKYDLIIPDLLGCGESDMPAGVDYSPAAQAEMLMGLLDSLDIKRVHLVTHDIGGAIGQILAARYSDRLIDATLINTVAYDYWPVQPIITFRVPILRQLAMAALDIRLFRKMVERAVYHKERITDEIMEKFYRPLKERKGRQGFLQLARCLDNKQLMEIMDDIHNTPVPVMLIRGDADIYLQAEISERLHDNIHGSRLERTQTGGHLIQLDEPDWLVEKIISFCSNPDESG